MKKFTLLVNGKDLDTGKYEYVPYGDKVIVDFERTYKIIASLKRGKEVDAVNDYIYAKYCIGDDNTNIQAIEAAYKASLEFRYFPVSIRRKILSDVHKNLLNRKKELLDFFVIEGHPRKLAEWEFNVMENIYNKKSLDYFKDELWTQVGTENEENIYLVRKADGVVCVSPPKNAPGSNSMLAVLALLSGNTLIIKPPLKSPLSTIYLWKEIIWPAVKQNGAPMGTINIVLGNAEKIMQEWLDSSLVNDILFFGNSERGLDLGKRIYMAGKKPILELSGNDMMFIWKDADIESATEALLDAFLGSTQICMVPKAAVIHKNIYDLFVEEFSQKVKCLKVGLPSATDTCLSPVVLMKEFYFFLEDALNKGGKLLFGGERINYKGEKDSNGAYIAPALLLIDDFEKALTMRCVKEENFFPLLPLVKVTGDSDKNIFKKMIDLANSNEYGLRTSVWVRTPFYIRRFIRYINNSGLLRINSRHVWFSPYLATHGGTGKTSGPYGEMNYLWQKTSHLQGVSLIREKVLK